MGSLGVAHRRDALDRGGRWIVDDQVLEGHDAQPTANHVEQLSRSEKEIRPCRSPKALVWTANVSYINTPEEATAETS